MPDTFTCTWLNRLDQLGFTDIELMVEHDQGIIPSSRVAKNIFCAGDYDSVDATLLSEIALDEVQKIIDTWNEDNPIS